MDQLHGLVAFDDSIYKGSSISCTSDIGQLGDKDTLTWDLVSLAIEPTPLPRPVPSSTQQVPWSQNTSSFVNSSEFRQNVDLVPKLEPSHDTSQDTAAEDASRVSGSQARRWGPIYPTNRVLGCRSWPDWTDLSLASYLGPPPVVNNILREGSVDIDARGGYYGTARQAASAEDRKDLVQIQLDKDADVKIEGRRYRTAALATASKGGSEVRWVILSRGDEAEIAADVVKAASVNRGSGEELIELLLRKRPERRHHRALPSCDVTNKRGWRASSASSKDSPWRHPLELGPNHQIPNFHDKCFWPFREHPPTLAAHQPFEPCHLAQPKTKWVYHLIRHFTSYLEVLDLSIAIVVELCAAAADSAGAGQTLASRTSL
ncbi:serine/threonine-protein kinase Sgk2 [Ilyonectria robusta]